MKRPELTAPFVSVMAALFLFVSCGKTSPTKPAPESPAAKESVFLQKGRENTSSFYSGEYDSLFLRFSPEMKAALSVADMADFHGQLQEQLGNEKALLFEVLDSVTRPYTFYERIVLFANSPDSFFVQWAINDTFQICGFQVHSLRNPGPNAAYRTQTPLTLPFGGEWTVFWGGRYAYQNYHTVSANQYYACDFLITAGRVTHTGDGTSNEQYYCFNNPVLAPGSGIITDIENAVDDNAPGIMNPSQPAGNYVIIQHASNEFSLLAHFKKGSITVRIGDSVHAGQEIGRCGNSGNSSEPHIHHHLQNQAQIFQGDGLPAQFLNYLADGNSVLRGEPVRGQKVRHGNP